ncbi:SusC/RagA family TonB-linked outer membrane protein [Proteiniphilum acetatigenes]|uniref:SusC/RagA family TonB-linked outer membrane protein n=1 Tax=Proteiniphilum acetatigenes TaxID=294710 RepID=UPI0003A0433C|nr:SusC/RagA family TonB-linked outer membrane protein [Proteiniphilum acetatigenes]SFK65819.1 TonB-linked outer membrane protein, SusC/RagA family [Porphyromonadaceae bacterium KH3CP3RA]
MKRKLMMLLALFFVGVGIVVAQTQVSGTVVDEAGDPVIGATIQVKGTSQGTVTDVDGNFNLSAPAGGTLVVSYVGMRTEEVPVSTNVRVVLASDTELLDELVVTALGISRDKKALGYAVSEVAGEEMIRARGGLSNPVNALQGKVAGLQISSGSGSMGGSSKILIRGVSSISGNNQPLFVIDGVPVEGTDYNSTNTQRGAGGYDYGNLVQDINPDDIENISVLKGAAASALYGSRANNGVIMITTKKGTREEGLGVSFTSSVGFETVNKLPKLQRLYGGGASSSFEQVIINGKTYNYPDYATDESWGPKLEGQEVLSWYDLAKWEAGGKVGDPTTSRWVAPTHDVEDFFETGISYTNNLSISQATDRASLRLSFTNTDLKGYLPNSSMSRNVFSIAGTTTSADQKLEAFTNVTYFNSRAKGRSEIGYGDNNVMVKFVQWGHRELDMAQSKDLYIMPDGSQATWNRAAWDDPAPVYSNNPYWSRYMNYQNDSRNRIYGNVGLSYKILPELKFQYKTNLDFFVDKQYERNAIGSQEQSRYMEISRQQYELNHEFMLMYSNHFDDYSLNANVGGNIMNRRYEYVYGETEGGLAIPLFYNLNNSISPAAAYNLLSKKGIHSIFGNVSAGWKNMLYLEATLRNDKSSTLPVGNNSYWYPSLTGSFIFSELLKEQSGWLSFGKLRAGWANVGNDTDPYRVLTTYTQYTNIDSSTPGYRLPNTLNNSELKPESTTSFEVGLETSFFNNRLGFDATYYATETKDQIIPLSVSGTTGYIYQVINSGIITNRGIELAFHATPVQTRSFSWQTSLMLSSNKNKVKELIDGVDYYRIVAAPFRVEIGAMKGDAYGVIMGTNYVFDDQGNRMIDPESGLYLATDGNENLGSIYPDFSGGWTNTFKIGNVDASILLDFSRGGHYFSTSYMFGMYSGMLEETAANGIRENGIILDGVIDENGTRNTTVADALDYASHFYTGPAAQSVFKSDYIKLREINVGYTFPLKKDKFVKSLRISAYGRNLAVWGPDTKHFDPEMIVTSSGNIQGIEGGAIPSVANFGASVSLKF